MDLSSSANLASCKGIMLVHWPNWDHDIRERSNSSHAVPPIVNDRLAQTIRATIDGVQHASRISPDSAGWLQGWPGTMLILHSKLDQLLELGYRLDVHTQELERT